MAGGTFNGADLSGANFSHGESGPVRFTDTLEENGELITLEATLSGANLSRANFQAAGLSSINLDSANLSRSNFRFADLRNAFLGQANLSSSDLRSANLADADLSQANLEEANLSGADLTRTDLTNADVTNAIFISTAPVDYPNDLTYEQFVSSFLASDCINGTYLLLSNGDLIESMQDVTINLGRRFYNSGDWRRAVLYICAADLSEATLHELVPAEHNLAGVNLRAADLRFVDLSRAILEDFIQVNELSYFLEADMRGIVYNNFTSWPFGFTPPSSAPAEEFQP